MVGQLDASLVAGALLAIAVLFRHKLSPSVRSLILLIALIRLGLPPWLRSPWSEALVDVPAMDAGRTLIATGLQSDAAIYLAAIASAVTLFLTARIVWTFATAEKRWTEATEPAPARLQRDGVDVRLSAGGQGPLAVGLKKKLVVLPASAVQLDDDVTHAVLAHEIAHHERRDLVWIAIAEVLKSIAWFNPLAHLIARALVASREDGSDDCAVARTSNDPFTYARALLQSARMVAQPQPLGVVAAHPMGKRLQRLLDGGAAREGRLGLAGIIIIVICGAAAIPGAHMPDLSHSDGEQRVVIRIRR
jgi:beta-lactamase regulating signal transducer with metallopeptidase domain